MRPLTAIKARMTAFLKSSQKQLDELNALKAEPYNKGKYEFEIWYLGEKGISKRLRDAQHAVIRETKFRTLLDLNPTAEELKKIEDYLYN